MSLSHPRNIIFSIAEWYRKGKTAGDLPFWIAFTIALYTPFEEFLLKWIPGSAPLRFVPELILYGMGANLIIQRIFYQKPLKKTPIDRLLVLFLVSVTISIIVNGSGVVPSLLTLRSLLRYVTVFYIVVNSNVALNQIQLILTGIKIVALIHGILASFLYFMPSSVQQLFAPKQFTIGEFERISAAEEGDIKVGAVFGLFTDPAVLSLFLLIGLILVLGQSPISDMSMMSKVKQLSALIVLFFGIYSTKKRAALLLSFLLPLSLLFFRKRIVPLLKLSWLYAALIFVGLGLLAIFGGAIDTSFSGAESREQTIDFTSYILQILSPEYYEQSTETSRGWVIQTVIHTISQSGSWFGFGPDVDHTRNIIYSLLTDGFDRNKIITLEPLEDVYWFAMLAYYGPIGLGLYIGMMWKLLMTGRWLCRSSPYIAHQKLGSIFCTLLLLTFISNGIERVLEVRPFSYYFWLFAGLVVNVHNAQKTQALQSDNQKFSYPLNSSSMN